jgi:diguanylate cyclase (GGDEF)-like protein
LFADDALIHLNGPGAPARWLRCEVGSGEGDLRLHFYTDVTREVDLAEENRRLRSELEDLRTTDALTGLANQRALARHLEMHVSRSRRYDNPLSLLHVELVAGGPEGSADAAMLAMGRHLRDRLRWVDEVARWEQHQFLVILPETGEAEAREVADKLLAAAELPSLPEPHAKVALQLRYGVASWQRGDDSRTLRRRAVADAEGNARAGHG